MDEKISWKFFLAKRKNSDNKHVDSVHLIAKTLVSLIHVRERKIWWKRLKEGGLIGRKSTGSRRATGRGS